MTAAETILARHWNGQLPVDPFAIASGLGIAVRAHSPFGAGDLSGESGKIELVEGGPVITYNSYEPRVRQRFTVAHEIGHLALGHLTGNKTLWRDTAANFSSFSDAWPERQANAFAADLLMPSNVLRYAVGVKGITSVDSLSSLFDVSQAAMGYRLKNLGMVHV
jgi:Zn-dependent peptidase ImmA (M78 family)